MMHVSVGCETNSVLKEGNSDIVSRKKCSPGRFPFKPLGSIILLVDAPIHSPAGNFSNPCLLYEVIQIEQFYIFSYAAFLESLKYDTLLRHA